MHSRLYERFLAPWFDLTVFEEQDGFVRTGRLTGKKTGRPVEIINHIPRFRDDGYCQSFGFQWSRFRDLQHDSVSKKDLSLRRLKENTRWELDALAGKRVLECGCGPGRFTEILARTGADVLALDMSRAIDVNLANMGPRENVILAQADIFDLDFLASGFDYVFCYGVLQHTPSPADTFRFLVSCLDQGGRISVDVYRKFGKPSPWSFPKYFWRPLTKHLRDETLHRIISWYIPLYIDFDTSIRKRGQWGETVCGMIPIPCWNYLHSGYTRDERIEHAIMDTFDALSPVYDFPQAREDMLNWFEGLSGLDSVEVFYGSNGLVANARRA